jgi:hypothetical protein
MKAKRRTLMVVQAALPCAFRFSVGANKIGEQGRLPIEQA